MLLDTSPSSPVPFSGNRAPTENIFSYYVPSGANCKVKDPRSGYEFNLTPLSGKDYEVKSSQYEYHFAVCGPIKTSVCPHGENNMVASCQVEGSSHRISGQYVCFCFFKSTQLGSIRMNSATICVCLVFFSALYRTG